MRVAAAMHDDMPSHDTMMQCKQVQHTLPCCKPMICLMAWISALAAIWAALASLTFSSFPLRSYTLSPGQHKLLQ